MTKTMTMNDVDIKELAMLVKKSKADTFRIVDKKKRSEPAFIILTWKRYKEILDILEGVEETEEILKDKEQQAIINKKIQQLAKLSK